MNLTTFLVSALTASGSFGLAAAADFEAIADVPQTPTKISIPGDCSCGFTFPPTMYTIETADSVTVSTNPPGLVTDIKDDGGVLKFTFAPEADGLTSGGIKIGMPAGQLTQVKANGGQKVQILSGFTSIDSLEANGASEIIADLSSNTASINLSLNGASKATIQSASDFDKGILNGASSASIATPLASNFKLNGASTMQVDGDVEATSLNGASSMTVSGAISGSGITFNGASSANAASCSTDISLNGASSCNPTSPSVTVTVTEQDTMGSGFAAVECWNCGFSWSGASSVFSSRAGLAATVAGVCLAM